MQCADPSVSIKFDVDPKAAAAQLPRSDEVEGHDLRRDSLGNYFLGVHRRTILICHDFATVRPPAMICFYAEKADYALYAALIATLTR